MATISDVIIIERAYSRQPSALNISYVHALNLIAIFMV